MIVAVASGKGGTGKTTLAVSLAQVAARARSGPVRLLDLDVEAPNAALFVRPEIRERRPAGIRVPRVDAEACDHCGRCVELCKPHALADVAGRLLVFDDLCIGCGVCVNHCPQHALHEVDVELGMLEAGVAGAIAFAHGRLHVGRAQPTPLIRDLKRWQLARPVSGVAFLDAPPGAACPVMEAARGADYVLLVTEPSPFGLHDLDKAAAALHGAMGLRAGVIINRSRSTDGDRFIEAFCRERGLPVLMKIPFDRAIAAAYAEGDSLVEARPDLGDALLDLLGRLDHEELVA